jgi:predicted outer membrane lipoprotein
VSFSWLNWTDTRAQHRLRVKAFSPGGPYVTEGRKLSYISPGRPALEVRRGILLVERILFLLEDFDEAIAQFAVAMGFLMEDEDGGWLLTDSKAFHFDAIAFAQLYALWLEFVSNMKRHALEEAS